MSCPILRATQHIVNIRYQEASWIYHSMKVKKRISKYLWLMGLEIVCISMYKFDIVFANKLVAEL